MRKMWRKGRRAKLRGKKEKERRKETMTGCKIIGDEKDENNKDEDAVNEKWK